jgi:hydroxymethylpyrimidine/phosphomethylpyrimidine kinase
VQDRSGFRELHQVDRPLLAAMIEAALDDGPVAAVKTGLLGAAGTVAAVTEQLRARGRGAPVVVDPVLAATAGGLEVDADVVAAYVEALVPLATIVTPNRPEVARLGGEPQALLALGAAAVLIKGGHGAGDIVEDRLLTADGETVIDHPRLAVGEVRGTGCALASALACELGRGAAIDEACRSAVAVMSRCLEITPPAADGGPSILVVQ